MIGFPARWDLLPKRRQGSPQGAQEKPTGAGVPAVFLPLFPPERERESFCYLGVLTTVPCRSPQIYKRTKWLSLYHFS